MATSRQQFMNSIIVGMGNANKVYAEHDLITIDNHGKPIKVMVLSDQEAKALISEEFGFEYGSIKIEDVCWYEATDWNYFRFSVKGWQYEARDYGLSILKQ
ncbi:MAG: hypothetical protein BWY15_00460 [Firmicutes bacterium ADurb.Bin193]|nr:MAG: hypothetical protein BWY15_00460 [Firmicutes bacterium ADurb.Bin193]